MTDHSPTPSTHRPGSILGTRVLRTEDPGLLTGSRRYLADLDLPDRLHAVFVRSDVAHGTLGTIHVEDAAGMPGVVEILTAAELGVAPHHGFAVVHEDFRRPPLADGKVRFVGEPIAVVLAETFEQGEDAAGMVWADIDELPADVDAEDALAVDAEPIFAEHGSNEAMMIVDKPRTDLSVADIVVRGRYVNQRMAVVPMEPDCCAAEVGADGRLTFWASTQMPHGLHGQLAAALEMDPADIRVVTPQVGGGFGGKAGIHAEYSVVAAAARRTGRSVVWVPPRSDDMKALPHSRGQIQYAELGCTADGDFTGLKVRLVGDAGAYPSVGAFLPGGTRRMAQGTYAFPTIEFDVAVAVTNTTPMGAYRGAGRPEATSLLERLVDQAALELGIDPIEIRRRNFLGDDVFPFRTLTGNTYDSGRYLFPLERAAEAAGYDRLRAEQAERRANGDHRLLGIGVAAYVEITAGGGADEFGSIEVHDDGSATIYAGTQSHGQGHQTAYAMLVADQTGIPVERITLVDGDTDRVRTGGGTGGSRSLQLGGSAVRGATEAMVTKAKQLAARLLEADEADIVVDTAAGTIGVAGVPAQALTWGELAARCSRRRRAARRRVRLPPGRRHLPVRCAHRHRRGRCRHRQGPAPAPRGRRRLRHGTRTAARRGPTARWHRGRRGPGAVRRGELRQRRQPGDLEPRRLRHRDSSRTAVVRDALDRDADAAQPARRKGHRRGGNDRGDPRSAERRDRRRRAPRGAPHRPAVHTRTRVVDDP